MAAESMWDPRVRMPRHHPPCLSPPLPSSSLSLSRFSPLGQASRRVGMRSPTTGARTRGSAATGVTGVDGVGFGDGGGGDVEEVGDGDGGGVERWGAAEHEVGVARPRGGGGGDVVLLLRPRRRPMALARAAPRRRGGRGGGRARAWRRRLGFAVASSPSARSAAAATTTTTRARAPPPPPPPPPPPLSRGEEDEREHGAAAGHRRWRRGYGESGSSRLHHGRRVPQPSPFRAAARRRGRGRCGGDRSAGEEEGVAVTGARGRRKVWRRPARVGCGRASLYRNRHGLLSTKNSSSASSSYPISAKMSPSASSPAFLHCDTNQSTPMATSTRSKL